jgi:hypothetical protein
MVNHALPIRYFVAISRPKPCPLLWEEKLKRIPSGIQTHTPSILKYPHFMGGVEPPEVAQLDTPYWGRVCLFRHGKLKSLSQRQSIMFWTTRVNYSLVVSIPET